MARWQAGTVCKEDIHNLAELTTHTYGRLWKRSGDADYYAWKLFGGDSPIPNGYVARDDGRAVGYQASCHRRFRFGQTPTWATELGDSMVHSEYRRQGMWESLTAHVIDNALEHSFYPVYGFPNKLSYPGYIKKLSMTKLLDVWRLVMVHQPEKLSEDMHVPAWTIKAANAPFMAARSISRRMMALVRRPVKVERVVNIGEWANDLWESARTNDEAGVIKDREYLHWRFEQNPDVYRIYRATRYGQTLGMLVTKVRAQTPDKVYGFIADMLVPSYDRSVMHALLLEAEFDFQADQVVLIDAWSTLHPFYLPTLVSFGFVPAMRLPFIVPQSQAHILVDNGWGASRRWVLTMADSDNI
jgi:GNAT superfamily N-acetyltransferase